jgi:hypothetical protein
VGKALKQKTKREISLRELKPRGDLKKKQDAKDQ